MKQVLGKIFWIKNLKVFLPCRLTVGQVTLDHSVMVRIHAGQPIWTTLHFCKEDEGLSICGSYSCVI